MLGGQQHSDGVSIRINCDIRISAAAACPQAAMHVGLDRVYRLDRVYHPCLAYIVACYYRSMMHALVKRWSVSC